MRLDVCRILRVGRCLYVLFVGCCWFEVCLGFWFGTFCSCSLFVVCSSLFVVWCILCVVCDLLCVLRCSLFVHGLSFVVRFVLFVACCVVCVV